MEFDFDWQSRSLKMVDRRTDDGGRAPGIYHVCVVVGCFSSVIPGTRNKHGRSKLGSRESCFVQPLKYRKALHT